MKWSDDLQWFEFILKKLETPWSYVQKLTDAFKDLGQDVKELTQAQKEILIAIKDNDKKIDKLNIKVTIAIGIGSIIITLLGLIISKLFNS